MKRGMILGTLLMAAWVHGQEVARPAFEVVSIKPSAAAPVSSGLDTDPGRLSGRNVTLRRCIKGAYNLPEAQILGGAKWVDEDRYFIEARADHAAGDRELMTMLQTLLAERFRLALHCETRQLSGYALVVGKGGFRAKPTESGKGSSTNRTRASIDATGCTLAHLAQKLSDSLHVPVEDLTGIGRLRFPVGMEAG
jgi:uncharacterized protein (TIGR03435 family)